MAMKLAQETQAVLGQVKDLLVKQRRGDLVASLASFEKNLTHDESAVLVCGEFKRGKSSLVGALLEQSDLCPVDIDIATAVVSTIRHGKRPRAFRRFGDIGSEAREEIPFEEIPKYATGEGSSENDTWLLEIETPCQWLAGGLVLIDSPGLGGLDPRHGFLTSHFLPRADIVLFVVDAGEPLSGSELRFLDEKVRGGARQVVVVLNKIDKVDRKNRMRKTEDIRAKLKTVMAGEVDEVVILPVSSRLKLDYLQTSDMADLAESGFPQLEKAIIRGVETRQKALMRCAIQEAVKFLEDIRAPLLVQTEGFQAESKDIVRLKKLCEEQKEHLQFLKTPSTLWRTELTRRISDLKAELNFESSQKKIQLLQQEFQQILEDRQYSKDPRKLIHKLGASLSQMALAIERQLRQGAEEIEASLQKHLQLNTGSAKLLNERLDFSLEEMAINFEGWGDRYFVMIRNTALGAGIGTSFLLLLPSTVNPIVGAVALGAALFTTFKGYDLGRKQVDEKRIRKLAKALGPELQKAMLNLDRLVANRFRNMERAFFEAAEREIERERRRYEDVALALQAVQKEDQARRKERQELVATQLEPIERILGSLSRLARAVDGID